MEGERENLLIFGTWTVVKKDPTMKVLASHNAYVRTAHAKVKIIVLNRGVIDNQINVKSAQTFFFCIIYWK